MKLRFVSWAAVSSLPQAKKVSLESQLVTNKQHIERWDGVLVEELIVPGESRLISLFEDACKKIDAYAKLRDLIARRAFDVLIFLDRSRLGRKASLSMAVVGQCHDAGIMTYSTESPPHSLEMPERNFAAQITGAIESVVAEQESTKMVKRHMMGMAGRVERGEFPGMIPYGWIAEYQIAENGRPARNIKVDAVAVEAINVFYDLYTTTGMSLEKIAKVMDERELPAPNRLRWDRNALSGILDLVWRYAGYLELNKYTKRNRPYLRRRLRWPALITEEQAKRFEDERALRAGAKRAAAKVHALSQVVWCQQCNHAMTLANRGSRGNQPGNFTDDRAKLPYFSHTNFRCKQEGHATHGGNFVAMSFVIEAVIDAIDFVKDERNRQEILGAYPDQSGSVRKNLEITKRRFSSVEESIQRADDAYVSGTMTFERYQRQIHKLQDEQVELSHKLIELEKTLDNLLFDSHREQRLIDLGKDGHQMLLLSDTASANTFFLQHIRVWIQTNGPLRKHGRVFVEYL